MPYDGTEISETARQLISARDYMAEHGWCQKNLQDPEGRVCMDGALRQTGASIASLEALRRAIGSGSYFQDYASVHRFNDWPGRTEAEVLAMWDRAIARETRR